MALFLDIRTPKYKDQRELICIGAVSHETLQADRAETSRARSAAR